ncbi:hypothetical protein B0T20DRAFT_423838 [Sordaria brevicollis]|uniref:NAD(P)-binding protein n=1 Tax=Sordaria brevicollis TaxID=83679 RepID=A0AAE0U570_SORBR|nr:hypothetical protein B0T20DRAFT_423838 [Sordaria brevicollis]
MSGPSSPSSTGHWDSTTTKPPQFAPRSHNDVYPFILPKRFRGALKDKVTIITGSAGTIGQALAECFAVAGAKLVLTYNNTPPPTTLKERCVNLGASDVSFVKCNVAELKGCEDLVKQVLQTQGKVDILINNAGANSLGLFDTQPPEAFIHELAVNLHGPYYLMRLLLPHFKSQHSGCVLNIASRAGTVAIPYSTGYCASKAALINLTACVQKELDVDKLNDVHLYSLHPGGIKSVMTLTSQILPLLNLHPPPSTHSAFTQAFDTLYDDSPYLNGMTCVALATGLAKHVLRGKYVDVGQDLEDILAQAEAIKSDENLYALHTSFLGGLENGGTGAGEKPGDGLKKSAEAEGGKEGFEFPGF